MIKNVIVKNNLKPTHNSKIATRIMDAVGIPVYIAEADVSDYAQYGVAETGWYVFAQISAANGAVVTDNTTVTGAAGYIANLGADHVDIAVRFGVAAESQVVVVNWGSYSETYIFRAVDLAIRNLDYRTTFYVYDIADFATWSYVPANAASFVGAVYYTEENGVYTQAAVVANTEIPDGTYYTHSYVLTADEVFQSGKTYYTLSSGVYTEAEVTAGDAVTESTYYEDCYTLTTDINFVGTAYYTEEDGVYTAAAVKAGEAMPTVYYVDQYDLTEDETFQSGKTYYTLSNGAYTEAEVIAGDAVTENTYYVRSYVLTEDAVFQGGKAYYTKSGSVYTDSGIVVAGASIPADAYYEHSYELTEDETFQSGTVYYTEENGAYTAATVTTGDAVTAGTYYVDAYTLTEDETFQAAKEYYTENDGVYTAAIVKAANEAIPTVYYVHSGVTFEGMTRNVTYRCNTVIDCPTTFILPEIEDETHGCWFEVRMRHSGTFSSTLVPPSSDVKIAVEHTQAETAGVNMVNLHYTNVAGIKAWRFMNTHSTII